MACSVHILVPCAKIGGETGIGAHLSAVSKIGDFPKSRDNLYPK